MHHSRRWIRCASAALALAVLQAWGCAARRPPAPPPPPETSEAAVPSEPPASTPPTSVPSPPEEDALEVKSAAGEILVAAWAEPSRLPSGGGPVQILVRVQKRGGRPCPGVEVRLATSKGSLYSGGRTLVTDARGLTRDRLTAQGGAVVTLNAGGTRYRFTVSEAGSEQP